jgi:hypothetical protein
VTTRTRAVTLLCALALVAGACSSPRVADDPTAAANDKAQEQTGKGKKANGKKAKGKGKKVVQSEGKEVADGPAAAAGEQPAAGPLQSLGAGGPEYARRSARVEENKPDAEKDGPLVADYAEAMAVDVEGLGKNLRITFTMNDNVPQKMSTDKEIMVIAFGLSGPNKKHGGFAFGAQGRKDGWKAYAGAKKKPTRFPGTFFVRGNQIEMTVPWEFVKGPRPFEFYASSSWFRSTGERNTSSFSFDIIPNDKGRYPS